MSLKSNTTARREAKRQEFAAGLGVPVWDVLLTQTEVGQAFSVSKQAVQGWTVHPAFPFGAGPPYRQSAIRKWHEEFIGGGAGRINHTLAQRQKRVEIRLKIERGKVLRTRRLIESGKYLEREFHDQLLVSYITETKGQIADMVDSYPARLERKNSAAIRAFLQQWEDSWCDHMCEWIDGLNYAEGIPGMNEPQRKDPKKTRSANARHHGRR